MELQPGLPPLETLLSLPPAIALSLVVSLDGQLRGPDGSSRSLSAPIDLELLRRLRASVDVVVVGRSTAELENYRTLTVRPEFEALRLEHGLAATPTLVVIDRQSPDLAAIARQHGRRMLLEAGITLQRVFAPMIERVWLSHAPVVVGNENAAFEVPLPPLRERWLADGYVVSRFER